MGISGPPAGFSLWREELKRAWLTLRGPHITPARAAASAALGLFIGSLPIFGSHTPLVLMLCLWFQLDAAVAWVMANVSNPFFAPALLMAEVQVGAWLRTGSLLRFDQELTRSGALHHFIGFMLVGAPVVGLALALFGGAIALAAASLLPRRGARQPYRLPSNAPEWIRAVEQVARRFASPDSRFPAERTRFHYLRAKLLSDPMARLLTEIADADPSAFGSVLDIGAGRGQLSLLLLELGRATAVRGLDWDERKLAEAKRAAGRASNDAARPEAVFMRGDLRTALFDPADTVLLVDVLHYFTLKEQDAILDRAAEAVRSGGRLILREADTDRGWRSLLTLAEERFFTFVRFNRGERVCFRPVAEIAARLQSRGLHCELHPAWGRTPFSNVLVVGRR
jgi:SAM-dependent methyltransferase/uncharacterized protein (DUF2062 family)